MEEEGKVLKALKEDGAKTDGKTKPFMLSYDKTSPNEWYGTATVS